jgi:hypothetical protein
MRCQDACMQREVGRDKVDLRKLENEKKKNQ